MRRNQQQGVKNKHGFGFTVLIRICRIKAEWQVSHFLVVSVPTLLVPETKSTHAGYQVSVFFRMLNHSSNSEQNRLYPVHLNAPFSAEKCKQHAGHVPDFCSRSWCTNNEGAYLKTGLKTSVQMLLLQQLYQYLT